VELCAIHVIDAPCGSVQATGSRSRQSRKSVSGRVGLARLPAGFVGLGLAGPAAATADSFPPFYFADTGYREIGVATGLPIGEFDHNPNLSAIDTSGYTDGLAVYGQQIDWTTSQPARSAPRPSTAVV
jgi:hypothetical protein